MLFGPLGVGVRGTGNVKKREIRSLLQEHHDTLISFKPPGPLISIYSIALEALF